MMSVKQFFGFKNKGIFNHLSAFYALFFCLFFTFFFLENFSLSQLQVSPNTITSCQPSSVPITAQITTENHHVFNQNLNVQPQDPFDSAPVNIGFTFSFFCNDYTSVLLSENNFLSFNTSLPYPIPFNYIQAFLPGYLNQSILFPFQDLLVTNYTMDQINAVTLGDPGQQLFVAQYCNIQFNGCGNLTSSTQVVLHEATNIIEIHLINKPSSCGYEGGTGIVGLINDQNDVVLVPGMDVPYTPWAATNISYRFTPTQDGCSYLIEQIESAPINLDFTPKYSDIEWTAGSNPNLVIGTGQEYTISMPNTEMFYVASYEVSGCQTGTTTLYTDTVWIQADTVIRTYYDTICQHQQEAFSWNGQSVNETGNHTLTNTQLAINQCDSTTILSLFVTPTITTNSTEHLCFSQWDSTLSWHGQTINSAGNYLHLDTVILANTCYHITEYILYLYDAFTNDTVVEICENMLPYIWENEQLSSSGTYSKMLQTHYNCDSLVTLTFIVRPTVSIQLADTIICEDILPFTWNNQSINSPGVHQLSVKLPHLQTQCDSTVSRTFIVEPIRYTHLADLIICHEQLPYTWHGKTIQTFGTGIHTLWDTLTQAEAPCDSIVSLNITIRPPFDTLLYDTICATSLPYTWHNQLINSVGNHSLEHILPADVDELCDSTITLQLTVHPNPQISNLLTLCEQSLPFIWNNDTIFFDPDDFTHRGTHLLGPYIVPSQITGCDSSTTLTLTIDTTIRVAIDTFFCWNNHPPYWNQHPLSSSGNYLFVDTLSSLVTGCDSIISTKIEIDLAPPVYSHIRCESELPFYSPEINGMVTSVGLYHSYAEPIVHISANQCIDSIYHFFSVAALDEVRGKDSIVSCGVQLPILWHGHTITDPSDETNGSGVLPGGLYIEDGYYVSYDTLGIIGPDGECPDVFAHYLWVEPPHIDHQEDTLCQRDLPFVWHNQVVNLPGIYTLRDTVKGVVHPIATFPTTCDSLYILDIVVHPTITTLIDSSICENNVPQTWNDIPISNTIGTQEYVYYDRVASTDCDSIVRLNLTIHPVEETILPSQIICESDLSSFLWAGKTIEEPGTHTLIDTLISDQGCYHFVKLNVLVHPTLYQQEDSIGLCVNDLGTFPPWNGYILSEAGVFELTHNEPSIQTGCDSLTSIVFVVNDVITTPQADSFICESSLPFFWNEHTITTTGIFELESLQKRVLTQCDSLITLKVHVQSTSYFTLADTILCEQELPYSWHEHTITTVGSHTISHTQPSQISSCDSIITRTVLVSPTKKDSIHIHLCDTDLPYTLTVDGYDTILATLGHHSVVRHKLWENQALENILCDSILIRTVFIGDTRDSIAPSHTLCEHELPYTWRGKTISSIGTHMLKDTFTYDNYCDSIISHSVTVIPTTYLDEGSESYCQEMTPIFWKNHTIEYAGTYDLSYEDIDPLSSCKRITSKQIIVSPTDKTSLFDTICESELPYLWSNHIISTLPSYPHAELLSDKSSKELSGCDSLTFMLLTVIPTFVTSSDSTICQSELSNFLWNGLHAQDTITQVLTYTKSCALNGNNTDETSCLITSCDSVFILNLTIQPEPTITHKDVSCFGYNDGTAQVIVNQDFNPYSYSWSTVPAQTTSSVNNLVADTYTVTVANERCTTLHTLHISEPQPLHITIDHFDIICFGENNGVATAQPSGGTMPYTYLWDDTNTQNTQTITNLAPGNYTVQVSDSNHCTGTQLVEIQEPDLLSVLLTHSDALCFGDNTGTIHVQVNGGIQPYSYLWNDPDGQTTQTAQNLFAGNYTVSISDSNGCSIVADQHVDQPEALILLLTKQDALCFEQNNGSITATVTGGTEPYTYSWNDPNGQTTQTAHNLFAGNYTVKITDSHQCLLEDSMEIQQPDKLQLLLSKDTIICPYDFASLTADYSGGTNPVSINWGNGENGWAISSQPQADTTYQVVITDAHGCQDTAKVTIQVVVLPIVDFTDQALQGCPPLPVVLYNLSTGNYESCMWSLSDGTIFYSCDSIHYQINTLGYHGASLTLFTTQGCKTEKSNTHFIYTEPWPVASFHPENMFYTNMETEVQFINTSIHATHYLWDFGDNNTPSTLINPSHIYPYQEGNTYEITLIASNTIGCVDTSKRLLEITEQDILYVPNAFTPDSDAYNRLFFPVISSGFALERYELLIFNRWGEIIYTTQDMYAGWDGTYKGVLQQSGTYTWKITIRAKDTEENKEFIGMVTLLK